MKQVRISRPEALKSRLKPGKVYRRSQLAEWSNSIDRELNTLVTNGTLQKLSQGVYYYPKVSVFGSVPPDAETLIREFLKDDRFLLTSPNEYNKLGVGTTQLYNKRFVYNHKRHGEFKLGNSSFSFKMKHHFPKHLSEEFLIVDLVNNLSTLLEDQNMVLKNVRSKVQLMEKKKLLAYVLKYGNNKTKKALTPLMQAQNA